jgi:myeloid leukemia factor 1
MPKRKSNTNSIQNHMNAMNMQMRSMNRLMNSFMPDPFNMLGGFDTGFQSNALMERGNGMGGGLFGFPAMPNINRLLNADIGAGNGGTSFSSSSVITMSSGPDGRPQIYQASQSTKTGPGGVRETRKTVQDSLNGVKKMAIGHHIGERAHIIEKEHDLRSGQLEERQEFINLEEDEAEQFDREFVNRASGGMANGRSGTTAAIRSGPTGQREVLTIHEIDDDDDEVDDFQSSQNRRQLAITAPPPTQHSHATHSVHPHPYNGGRRHHQQQRSSKGHHHHAQKHKDTSNIDLEGVVTAKQIKTDKAATSKAKCHKDKK